MIVKGSFSNCAAKLLSLMKTRKGIQYVLTQEDLGGTYALHGLEDPDLDWSKAASGEMRVVLCVSQVELTTLQTIFQLKGQS